MDVGSVASTLRLPGGYSAALERAQALSLGYSRGEVTSTDVLQQAGLSDFFSPTSELVVGGHKAWQDTETGDWALNTHQ